MKKLVIFLITFVFVISIISAVHNSSVSLPTISIYETKSINTMLSVSNTGDLEDDSINKIVFYYNNITINSILNINSWTFTNDLISINWSKSSGITPLGSQSFPFTFTANKVNSDINPIFRVVTIDDKNTSYENNVSIIIKNDYSGPNLWNVKPANNSFVFGKTNEYFSVNAEDNETGLDYGVISYKKCTDLPPYNQVNLSCTNNICQTNIDLSNYNEGEEVCYIIAMYNNAGEISNLGTIGNDLRVKIDKTAPLVTLIYPVNNLISNLQPLSFNFTSIDNMASEINCSLYVNSVLKEQKIVANGSDDFFITNLTEGTNIWEIMCKDEAGNTNISEERIFIYDTTPPTINIESIVGFNKGIINIAHTESDSNFNSSGCKYKVNSGPWESTSCNSNLFFDTTLCPDGKNSCNLTFASEDLAGNVGYGSVVFSVDNSNPSINYVDINDTDRIVKSGDNIFITSDGTDEQGVSECRAILFEGSKKHEKILNNNTCSGEYVIPLIASGNYVLNVEITNNAGSTNYSSINLSVDNTNPVIVITNPKNNSNSNGTLKFDFSVNENCSLCRLLCNNVDMGSLSNVEINGSIEGSVNSSNEVYSCNVICKDLVGNEGLAEIFVYFDNIAPLIGNISLTKGTNYFYLMWNTDTLADSRVYYGENENNLNNSYYEGNLTLNHSAIIVGLQSSTLYYYYIESRDVFDNSVNSSIYNLTTDPIIYSGSSGSRSQKNNVNNNETNQINSTSRCVSNWVCTSWSSCKGEKQTRTCVDLAKCETDSEKPLEFQTCKVQQLEEKEENPNFEEDNFENKGSLTGAITGGAVGILRGKYIVIPIAVIITSAISVLILKRLKNKFKKKEIYDID